MNDRTKDLQGIPDAMLTPAQKELAKAQRTSNPQVERLTGSLWMITKPGGYTHINQLGRVYREKSLALRHKDYDEVVVELRLAVETSRDDARDAARYRFLRQPGNAIVYAKDRNAWGKNASGHVRYDTAEQLDAAVDAARGAVEPADDCRCGCHSGGCGRPDGCRCGRDCPCQQVNGTGDAT